MTYKDGFGKEIPEEDKILRQKLIKDLEVKFSRHIEYEGNFRAGEIIYTDINSRLVFTHEMGGGNCMFYIEIPSEEKWKIITGLELTERKPILEFVAEKVRAEKASDCRYEIKEESISFYSK